MRATPAQGAGRLGREILASFAPPTPLFTPLQRGDGGRVEREGGRRPELMAAPPCAISPVRACGLMRAPSSRCAAGLKPIGEMVQKRAKGEGCGVPPAVRATPAEGQAPPRLSSPEYACGKSSARLHRVELWR